MAVGFFSSDERKAELKRLWLDEGRSGTEISKHYGGAVTRVAVIAAANRNGWARDPTVTRAAYSRGQLSMRAERGMKPVVKEAKPARTTHTPAVTVERGANRAVVPIFVHDFSPVLPSVPKGCRWPIGDPVTHYCEASRERGSYCAAHAARAYVAPTKMDGRLKALR